MLEIAIVLCSVLLVVIPAIATDQTSQEVSANTITAASEDDYVLDVYGNANEDDTIDMRDLTYVKLIFFGKKPETELADAKYDGKINPLDFIQIKLIIVGKEKELTIVDSMDIIVTVSKPVKRIIPLGDNFEPIKILRATNRIVGICDDTKGGKDPYFPEAEAEDIPSVGKWYDPDCEAIADLSPDIVVCYTDTESKIGLGKKLKPFGISVIALESDLHYLKGEMQVLGYVLDEKVNAEKFIDWFKKYEHHVETFVNGLTQEEKTRVLMEGWFGSFPADIPVLTSKAGPGPICTRAGGINIAADLPGSYPKVSWEWVLEESETTGIDVIILIETSMASWDYWGWDNIDDAEKIINDYQSRPGAESISAVKNNKVYICEGEPYYGPDTIVGLVYWTKIFHPEFEINPETVYSEYVQMMDISYPENKIFVYPLLED